MWLPFHLSQFLGTQLTRFVGMVDLVAFDIVECVHSMWAMPAEQLEHCVEIFKLPADSKDLLFVTRLAELALSARPQLREKRYSFPEPSSLLVRTFYPIICEYIADAKIAKLQRVGPRDVPPNPVNDDLVDIVKNDEVARSITMVRISPPHACRVCLFKKLCVFV
jgi:hypothetical protein